jgi:flagellar biosynthesis protein FlhB
MATNPTHMAAIQYQAGAMGFPVVLISQVTAN